MSGIGPISETPPAPALFAGVEPATWTGTTAIINANYMVLNAFTVPSPITISKAYFLIGVQSGNIAFAIYDASSGGRLGTTGSFACPATGPNSRALTAAVTLLPGVVYYRAYATDNNTVTVQMTSAAPLIDILVNGAVRHRDVAQNGAFPPPTNATIPGTALGFVTGVVFA